MLHDTVSKEDENSKNRKFQFCPTSIFYIEFLLQIYTVFHCANLLGLDHHVTDTPSWEEVITLTGRQAGILVQKEVILSVVARFEIPFPHLK